jgi:hypothetical protein
MVRWEPGGSSTEHFDFCYGVSGGERNANQLARDDIFNGQRTKYTGFGFRDLAKLERQTRIKARRPDP